MGSGAAAGTGSGIVGGCATCRGGDCAACCGGGSLGGATSCVGSVGGGMMSCTIGGAAGAIAGSADGAGSNTIATRVAPGMSGRDIRLGSSTVNTSRHAACVSTDSDAGTVGAAAGRSCLNRTRSAVIGLPPGGTIERACGSSNAPSTRPAWAAWRCRSVVCPALIATTQSRSLRSKPLTGLSLHAPKGQARHHEATEREIDRDRR